MERNVYPEGFEGFLREKAEQYKMYPGDSVWKQLETKLRTPKRSWRYGFSISLLIGLSLLSIPHSYKNSSSLEASSTIALLQPPDLVENSAFVQEPVPAEPKSRQIRMQASMELRNGFGNQKKAVFVSAPAMQISRTTGPDIPSQTESSDVLQADPPSNLLTGIRPEEISDDQTRAGNPKILTPHLTASVEKAKLDPMPAQQEPRATGAETLLKKAVKKTTWQFYVTPSLSYRKLVGSASKSNFTYSNGIAYSANLGFARDVNEAVHHRPAVGFEVGTSLIYSLSKGIRVKVGMQLNHSQYDIEAYDYVPELAPFGANSSGAFARQIEQISHYRNFSGLSKTMLTNERFMASVPLGVELRVIGNRRISFDIASTIQPTFVLSNESYLISTNLKNYAKEPSLNRRWNVNAGFEAFMTIHSGPVKWVVGPQVRYQMLSSFKDNYPIREHLMEYGIKLGVSRSIFPR